jgi:hypothetical protein
VNGLEGEIVVARFKCTAAHVATCSLAWAVAHPVAGVLAAVAHCWLLLKEVATSARFYPEQADTNPEQRRETKRLLDKPEMRDAFSKVVDQEIAAHKDIVEKRMGKVVFYNGALSLRVQAPPVSHFYRGAPITDFDPERFPAVKRLYAEFIFFSPEQNRFFRVFNQEPRTLEEFSPLDAPTLKGNSDLPD